MVKSFSSCTQCFKFISQMKSQNRFILYQRSEDLFGNICYNVFYLKKQK